MTWAWRPASPWACSRAPRRSASRAAGLDYYNHNLDTSPEFYGQVITTRTYQDRLDTLAEVQRVGLKVCSGGILGMGESRRDRAGSALPARQSAPAAGVGADQYAGPGGGHAPVRDAPLDPFELVRTVAVARILMPDSHVRLSAGRSDMSDELQALCYLAGANSIFYGDRLLTTPNAEADRDLALFERLGLSPEAAHHPREAPGACHSQADTRDGRRRSLSEAASRLPLRRSGALAHAQHRPSRHLAALALPAAQLCQLRLDRLRRAHLYRRRRVLSGPQGPRPTVDGRAMLAFCSNDYLGLANHPEVVAALQAGAARYGAGSGSAHLVSGHSAAHQALEEELADFSGATPGPVVLDRLHGQPRGHLGLGGARPGRSSRTAATTPP